jgi:hypothetical protein
LLRLAKTAMHLIVSAGGNDALVLASPLPRKPATSFEEAMQRIHELREEFRPRYRFMIEAIVATGKPATVCTIYDAIPGLPPGELAGLAFSMKSSCSKHAKPDFLCSIFG